VHDKEEPKIVGDISELEIEKSEVPIMISPTTSPKQRSKRLQVDRQHMVVPSSTTVTANVSPINTSSSPQSDTPSRRSQRSRKHTAKVVESMEVIGKVQQQRRSTISCSSGNAVRRSTIGSSSDDTAVAMDMSEDTKLSSDILDESNRSHNCSMDTALSDAQSPVLVNKTIANELLSDWIEPKEVVKGKLKVFSWVTY
jgi:hypothetical protein